ncbi:hypothetical protein EII29_11140, partial [Leptotrichia sp. OH3620_COT-345]|uniref:hypothetical protein n=1 Tax=Leptotrichia sp. OH3620_COT-345 TaxID=2491048 RepID=UPI000F980491
MKKSLIITFTFLLLLSQCGKILKLIQDAKHRKVSRQILNDLVIEMKRDYNLIVDKDNYEVKALGVIPRSVLPVYYFGIIKKGKVEYKSKYFEEYENDYYVFEGNEYDEDKWGFKFSQNLFGMLSFGLRSYVLNNLLYDKSKGNNFEEIEKIFIESGYKIKPYIFNFWVCGEIEDDIGGGGGGYLNFVKDEKCNEEIRDKITQRRVRIGIKKYMEKFKEYFSVERELETIDWEEYMKF